MSNELITNYESNLEEWAGDDPKRRQYIDKWEKIKKRDGEDAVYDDLAEEMKRIMYDNNKMIKRH